MRSSVRLGLRTALLAIAALAAGCNFALRRWLDHPGVSQVIRVESGERIYFDLEEDPATDGQWYATSDDDDVLVKVDHHLDDCVAKVEIRIHRGYDGPSTVNFRYRRSGGAKPLKEFTITLFKRTGDVAFWE